MPELRTGVTKRMALDDVVPYWRNPRQVPAEAVEAIRQSIEQFGFQQPIVVDSQSVIIIGHTRYAALRRLAVTEVDVMVVDYLSDKQVKELRVIDNRSAEYTTWDLDKLFEELDGLDSALLRGLFSDVMPDFAEIDLHGTVKEQQDADDAEQWKKVDDVVEFVCPTCFHEFEVKVTRDDILKGRIGDAAS